MLAQLQSVCSILVKCGSEVFIVQCIYAGTAAANSCACLFPKEVAETGKMTKRKYSVCPMQHLVVLMDSCGAKNPKGRSELEQNVGFRKREMGGII